MNNMLFLPEDYQAPKTSNLYFKPQDGENKIRILSQPILGWEDWKDNKPVRYRLSEKPTSSFDPKKPLKHFWAMIIWNYAEEQIQIYQITQASIRSSIEALSHDTDWGLPYFYDIKIIRKGNLMETAYMVNPLPHRKLEDYIEERFYERPCKLEALFSGEDPFSMDHIVFTQPMFNKIEKIIKD